MPVIRLKGSQLKRLAIGGLLVLAALFIAAYFTTNR